jgi:hypothetical protein
MSAVRHPLGSGAARRLAAGLLIGLLATASTGAMAQSACPDTAQTKAEMLQGHWLAELTASATAPAQRWQLELGPHPDYPGSLRGELVRGAVRYPVAADLDDGEFTMEESHDGLHIAATWLGEVVEGSCAQLLRGVRQSGSADAAEQGFVLRRHRPR